MRAKIDKKAYTKCLQDAGLKKRPRKPMPKFENLFLKKGNSSSINEQENKQFYENGSEHSRSNSQHYTTATETSGDTFDKLIKNSAKPKKSHSPEKLYTSSLLTASKISSSSSSGLLFNSPKNMKIKSDSSFCSSDFIDDSYIEPHNVPKIFTKITSKKYTRKAKNSRKTNVSLSKKKEKNYILCLDSDEESNKFPKKYNSIPNVQSSNVKDKSKENLPVITSTPALPRIIHKGLKEIVNECSPVPSNEIRSVFEDSSLINSFDEEQLKLLTCKTVSSDYFDAVEYKDGSKSISKQSFESVHPSCKPCSVFLSRNLSYSIASSLTSNNEVKTSANKVTKRRKVCLDRSKKLNNFKQPHISSLYSFCHSKVTVKSLKNNNSSKQLKEHSSIYNSLQQDCSSNFIHDTYLQPGKSWKRRFHFISKVLNSTSRQGHSDMSKINSQSAILQRSHYIEASVLESPSKRPIHFTAEEAGELVFDFCHQHCPLPIEDYFDEEMLSRCKKIGEGVFGEVFVTTPKGKKAQPLVSKLMPIEGQLLINGEPQKSFKEISSEIAISFELSKLNDSNNDDACPSFVLLHQTKCLKGVYPPALLEHWDQFDEVKGSENDRPDQFLPSQLYILLEFENAGRDLESFVFTNAVQGHDLFMQVAYGLAVAEKKLEFEHRDLHWGNVLVSHTKANKVTYKFGSKLFTLPTKGIKAKIIDFTLSRVDNKNRIYFYDLEDDPSMFTAEGDIQFEVYRQMQKINKANWMKFTPKTNILWLEYLLKKIMTECHYKNTKTKIHQKGLKQLRSLVEQITSYDSALDFVYDQEGLHTR